MLQIATCFNDLKRNTRIMNNSEVNAFVALDLSVSLIGHNRASPLFEKPQAGKQTGLCVATLKRALPRLSLWLSHKQSGSRYNTL